ncbi:MAG TPA: alpha/beta fold hydrolase [Actinomycetota bacterium]
MSPRPRSRIAWLLSLAVVLGLLSSVVPASAGAPGPAPAPWAGDRKTQVAGPTDDLFRTSSPAMVGDPVFHPCGDRIEGGRCGRIEVWADPRFQGLGTMSVGFVRFPRRDRDTPSQGTIVAVEGGPGYSTIGTRSWYLSLFRPLMDHRSLLLMDLRGTGRSDAIDCPELQTWRTGSHSMSWAAAEAACARQLGPLASRYGSAFAADDLATLLDGLGIEGIDLYGDSYGTFFAQTFAVRHPDLVDTLTVDAAYPIEGADPWWRDLNDAAVVAVRRSCERDPTCQGNPVASLRDLVRRVRREPFEGMAPDADGRRWRVKFTPASMNVALGYSGYSSPIDRELVAASRAALGRHPDTAPLLRILAENEWHYGGGDVHVYSQGLASATSCNDYPLLWDRFASVPERKQGFVDSVADLEDADPRAFDPVRISEWAWSPDAAYRSCIRWPAPKHYVPPFPDAGAYPNVPTLVLVGEFDSVTSPAGSRQVSQDFPGATFVEVPNGYHVTALGDRAHCVERIVRRFVRTTHPGDTACVGRDYPPVRVVARFPETAADVHGSRAHRAAVIAAGTVGDVMARWSSMYGYDGVGLRGGTFKTVGLWTPSWWLRGVRWVQDVPVDGTIESNFGTGVSMARVTLAGGGVPPSTLRIRWNSLTPMRPAVVTGRVGAARVHQRVPTP